MKVRSMRIPEDIDLAIQYISKVEKIESTQSLRKLARLGFESYVARKYQGDQMTLREAAGLLNMPLSETLDLLSLLGVKGNIHAGDVLASLNTFAPLD
ncbi:MAG: hypothetical protein JEZ11_13300 [Desulfobacterales bacterium]|nr:hypothetical protein [Desulfobacterales bacterium]